MTRLELVRSHEANSRNSIYSGAFEYQEKYKDARCEISRFVCKKEIGFTIEPSTDEASLASYYIHHGSCFVLEGKAKVEAGDMFVLRGCLDYFNIVMLEDTDFIIHKINWKTSSTTSENINSLKSLINQIDEKDAYTKGHSERVCALAKKMGIAFGFSGKRYLDLVYAAQYHDIGKVMISDAILNKREALDEAEYAIMKKHPEDARRIVSKIFDENICSIIEQHHERIDGSGYPRALKGDEIRMAAQIIGVCDSYDAIMSQRIYKCAMDGDRAMEKLRQNTSPLFGAEILEKLDSIRDKSFIDVCLSSVDESV